MSPTMNSSRSLGPITRFRSGSGPFTSCVAGALALMALPFPRAFDSRHGGLDDPCGATTSRPWRVTTSRRPGRVPSRGRGRVGSAEEDLGLGVLLGADELELPGALDERDPDDVRAAQRHHG